MDVKVGDGDEEDEDEDEEEERVVRAGVRERRVGIGSMYIRGINTIFDDTGDIDRSMILLRFHVFFLRCIFNGYSKKQ